MGNKLSNPANNKQAEGYQTNTKIVNFMLKKGNFSSFANGCRCGTFSRGGEIVVN